MGTLTDLDYAIFSAGVYPEANSTQVSPSSDWERASDDVTFEFTNSWASFGFEAEFYFTGMPRPNVHP